MARGRINRKLLRMFEGNTRAIPDHMHHVYDQAEARSFKENGVVYKRPVNMHMETLAGPRCVHAFRRGR